MVEVTDTFALVLLPHLSLLSTTMKIYSLDVSIISATSPSYSLSNLQLHQLELNFHHLCYWSRNVENKRPMNYISRLLEDIVKSLLLHVVFFKLPHITTFVLEELFLYQLCFSWFESKEICCMSF